MGTLIKAVCKSCDFRKRFRFGSGMLDFGKICWVPAISPQGKFEVVDSQQKLLAGYRLYTDPELYEFDLNESNGIQNFETYLSPDKNLCPNCKKKKMEFQVYGKYD